MRWRRGTGVVSCKRTATPDRSILSSSSIACTRLISLLRLIVVWQDELSITDSSRASTPYSGTLNHPAPHGAFGMMNRLLACR